MLRHLLDCRAVGVALYILADTKILLSRLSVIAGDMR